MAIFVGLDVHRAQITYDALDTDSGEVTTGRIRPANRATVRAFLVRLATKETIVAVEAMTGWRFVAEECARAGIDVRLAEPAETRERQDRKRRAKTDKLDARLLRELLIQGRLPESWIAPAHILDLRAKVRLRKTLVDQRTSGCSASTRCCFTTASRSSQGASPAWTPGTRDEQLAELELPAVARQQVTVALGIIEHLNGELRTLDVELERVARRQAGCRALMGHYGIGPSSRRRSSPSLATPGGCRLPSNHDYYLQLKDRVGANRAALTIARKLLRRAHHTLRELGDAALASTT